MARVILGKYKGIEVPAWLTRKEKQDYIIRTIVKMSTVKVPESEVDDQAHRMVEKCAAQLAQRGLSIEQYYQVADTDETVFVNQMKVLAENHLKERMVLEAIAREEGIAEKKARDYIVEYAVETR